MKVIVKLNSVTEHFGQRRNLKNTSKSAAFNKLKKDLKGKSDKKVVPPKDKERKRPEIDHIPMDYFANDKSTRSKILLNKEITSVDEIDSLKVDNIILTFEGLPSLDVREIKTNYARLKENATKKYFGDVTTKIIPEGLVRQYQEEMSGHATTWVRNQITVIVYDTEKFEGASYDEVHNVWVYAVKTKTIIKETFLTKQEVGLLINSPNSDVIKVKREVCLPYVQEKRADGQYYHRAVKNYENLDDFVGIEIQK